MSEMQVYMVNCTDTICAEVAVKEIKQKEVALSYACALRTWAAKIEEPDWQRINRAILDRWSMSGLERIKKRAMDICAGKVSPFKRM